MLKMICELCSSGEFTKDDDGLFVCDYCRTKYTPQQAKSLMVEGVVQLDRSADAQKLVILANAALDNQNPSEAYDYASRALEIDPENPAAWLCKGKAAGWSSSIANLRFTEMIGAFRSAERFTPEEERQSLLRECAESLNGVAVAIQSLSWNHASEFAVVEGTWQDHINRSDAVIAAFWQAYEWDPDSMKMKNVVEVASQLITGVRYNSGLENGVRYLNTHGESLMRKEIERASAEIRKFESDYVAPTSSAPTPSSSSCFVVTATMGNENALPVTILREYRDSILTESGIGRRFISWYGVNGPRIAVLIRKIPALRVLSFGAIVLPASVAAWVSLKLNSALKRARGIAPLLRHSPFD